MNHHHIVKVRVAKATQLGKELPDSTKPNTKEKVILNYPIFPIPISQMGMRLSPRTPSVSLQFKQAGRKIVLDCLATHQQDWGRNLTISLSNIIDGYRWNLFGKTFLKMRSSMIFRSRLVTIVYLTC